MKTLLITLIIGLLLVQCSAPETKKSSFLNAENRNENNSILSTLIQADTIIDKKLPVVKQPSKNFYLIIYENGTELAFEGRVFFPLLAEYFELDEIDFFNKQKQNQMIGWDATPIKAFSIIDKEPAKKNKIGWLGSEKKFQGYQLITMPIYNIAKNRAVVCIKKVIDNDNNAFVFAILDKTNDKWSIRKVFERY